MNRISSEIYNNFNNLLPLDLQGWHSDDPVFEKLIIEVKPKTIIEVGTWKGGSAINMANICKKNQLETKIYCVDTWLGALEFWCALNDTAERDLMLKNGYPSIYYQFLSNVIHTNNQDVILPVPITSTIASKYFKFFNIKADLIYVDGSHDYEDVLSDIKNYMPLLNDGGIMFGDDYGGCWMEVVQAVKEYFGSSPSLSEVGGFWFYKK